jgi:hypothetical protein
LIRINGKWPLGPELLFAKIIREIGKWTNGINCSCEMDINVSAINILIDKFPAKNDG